MRNIFSAFQRGLASSFRSTKSITFFAKDSRCWAGERLEAQDLSVARDVLRAFDSAAVWLSPGTARLVMAQQRWIIWWHAREWAQADSNLNWQECGASLFIWMIRGT